MLGAARAAAPRVLGLRSRRAPRPTWHPSRSEGAGETTARPPTCTPSAASRGPCWRGSPRSRAIWSLCVRATCGPSRRRTPGPPSSTHGSRAACASGQRTASRRRHTRPPPCGPSTCSPMPGGHPRMAPRAAPPRRRQSIRRDPQQPHRHRRPMGRSPRRRGGSSSPGTPTCSRPGHPRCPPAQTAPACLACDPCTCTAGPSPSSSRARPASARAGWRAGSSGPPASWASRARCT